MWNFGGDGDGLGTQIVYGSCYCCVQRILSEGLKAAEDDDSVRGLLQEAISSQDIATAELLSLVEENVC